MAHLGHWEEDKDANEIYSDFEEDQLDMLDKALWMMRVLILVRPTHMHWIFTPTEVSIISLMTRSFRIAYCPRHFLVIQI